MPFKLLNERAQKKISTAKNGLSLSVFVMGVLITGFLADTFYQSELKYQHENLTSQAREFYKIQNSHTVFSSTASFDTIVLILMA